MFFGVPRVYSTYFTPQTENFKMDITTMPFQMKSDKDCVADSGLPVFGFAPRLHIVTWYSERAHKLLTRKGMWEKLEFAIVSCIHMPFISKATSWPR